MNPRRQFLQQAGILTAGMLVNSCTSSATESKKIGIQLYTLRDEISKDVKGIINKVAAAGYKEVETFGLTADEKFFGLSVKEFGQLLKDNNLTTPSGHYTPAAMLFENGNGDDVKKLCDVGNTLGHEYIIIPYLDESKRSTIDQYKALADRINKAGEICKTYNLKLAYHNHDFEFLNIDGQRGYDILLDSTDKSLVKMELDIYWVVRAGVDPIELFKRQPGRFELWHIKDMDKADMKKNTEIGNGSIDFKKIMQSANLSGVKHYFLEQENNYVPDPIASIQTSFNYIKKDLMK
ncbi:MAG: sugar phosphate isomerase/epimerase [Ferruginibacter sp.]